MPQKTPDSMCKTGVIVAATHRQPIQKKGVTNGQ